MKKIFLITFSLAFTLIGCKKEENRPTTIAPATGTETKPETISETNCYLYNQNGSRVELHLQLEGSKASGKLSYAFAEKDSNVGNFIGTFEDSILLADYTFGSEGVTSTRQVAFKLQGEQLIEGYGEMNEDGTKFKDAAQLKFSSTMPLSQTDCPK